MITSANPMEGKSIVLANLAIAMAQAGQSVIVVDADLRWPTQHEIMHLDNHRGLSNALLEHDVELSEYEQEVELDRLSVQDANGDQGRPTERARGVANASLRVITSGPIPPNPADLLASDQMGALIERLKTRADVVLFDAPPVLAVTDAAVLSTRIDGVLLLGDAGRTRRAAAKQAVQRLRQVDAHLLGVILNKVSIRGSGYYANAYYYGDSTNGSAANHGRRRVDWGKLRAPAFLKTFMQGKRPGGLMHLRRPTQRLSRQQQRRVGSNRRSGRHERSEQGLPVGAARRAVRPSEVVGLPSSSAAWSHGRNRVATTGWRFC